MELPNLFFNLHLEYGDSEECKVYFSNLLRTGIKVELPKMFALAGRKFSG
jgi:hypothetical protein